MAKFKGPTFRYGPNGEAAIFHDSADVPAGWADRPHPPAPEKSVEAPRSDANLSRQQIIAALQERGIVFQRNASTASLYERLVEAVERTEA